MNPPEWYIVPMTIACVTCLALIALIALGVW
jgi:hypothetical protein